MATIWVSTSGTDTATGTNLGAAVKTIGNALPKAGPGGTINMVNDGVHPARSTGLFINITYNGTNYTTDPGLIIRGVDTSGDPAVCTVAMTAGALKYLNIDDASDFVWVEGLRFDYTALRGVATGNMYPVTINAQAQSVRLNDCEIALTTAVGSSVSLTTNTGMPRFPYVGSAGSASGGTVEIYNNIFVNSRMYTYNPANSDMDIHNNIFVHDAADFVGSTAPSIWTGGNADELRRFSHNTMVAINYGDDVVQQLIEMNQNNTTNLAFHSNLVFVETGSTASAPLSGYLMEGSGSAAQTTTVVTISNNYVAIGANLALESTAWDTSTATGIYNEQLNSSWRGGSTADGTALNTDDAFGRGVTIAEMFNDYTSSYTWTPGDYSHDLPFDLRPLLGRTDALGGGVVGAIDDAVNADPVVVTHTYSATCGVLKSVNSTLGLLAGSSDPDGDTLSATIVAGPSHGVAVLNTTTGAFGFTPNITYTGTDTFTYKAWDGTTFSNVSTATINITNTPPTGQDHFWETTENSELTVDAADGMLNGASAGDVGQTASVTNIGTPSHGTLNIASTTTGEFEYEPDPFYTGGDAWEFQITDGNTNSATHQVVVHVVAVNPPADVTDPAYIDAAPFFMPTLNVQTEFSFRNTKNRVKDLDLRNYTEKDNKWNEATSRVITVAAGSTIEITMGGVSSAQYLILETDQSIEVSIDGTAKYWPVSKMVALALSEFISLHLHSLSTTNAQVILTMAD